MEIKQFELREKAALLSFLQIVYPENPRMSDERFWDWHFLENPYVEPSNMPIWVAVEGAEIVGQMAGTPVRLRVGKRETSAMWIIDLMIRPDYRRRGLMKKLVLASVDYAEIGLGMNTAEQHSTALLESVGWKMFGKIPRYNKLLFPGEALREISRIKVLRGFTNAVFAPFRPHLGEHSGDGNTRRIEKFDNSVDELWRDSADAKTCAVVREAAILNWQYFSQPDKKFDVLGYYENGKMLGYIVVYFRRTDEHGALSKAAITDLNYHPSKPSAIIDELLKGALRLAIERRAGALVTDVLDAHIASRLKSFGFGKVKNPLQLLVKSAAHNDILQNTEQWFATRGDADASVFEPTNQT